MKRWEVCLLSETAIKSPLVGKKTWAWQAMLMTTDGSAVIAQSEGWIEGDYDSRIEHQYSIIAKLAADGWEPIPLPDKWVFKRPLVGDEG